MTLLYIDPGTGSMLFTIVTGLATTLYFVAKAALLRAGTFFAGRGARAKTAKREAIVIYSEGRRYWNVFLPVVEELERRGLRASFLSSEEDDPVFSAPLTHVSPHFIGKGNVAYARLNMLEADLCLMTTPGLDVYQLKRSRGVRHYSHLLHAVDDATNYRLFGLDYFDSVLLSGAFQGGAIRELEGKRGIRRKELEVVGSTYLDVYLAELGVQSPDRDRGTTVLVSPSWGESGLLRRYGEELLLPLAETGLKVIVRPHPQSVISEPETIRGLRDALAAYPRVEWDFERENLPSLSRSDIMISDFSGIVFDFAFLYGRPVLYALQDYDVRPYDASDVDAKPWKFTALEALGKELSPEAFPKIGEIIRATLAENSYAGAIGALKDEAWQHRGQSGARVVDFIERKLGQSTEVRR